MVQEAAEQKRKEKNNLYTASRRGQNQSVFLGISISFMILQDSVQTHLFTVFLTIDTTFNLGNFCVTPTTYRHLLLESNSTGKNPLFVNPILL